MKDIMILGESIPVKFQEIEIEILKFLKDNPRVYSSTHAVENFETKHESEQQIIIYETLRKEQSVKKLIPDIKRHKGLMEPILVRFDSMEVIEGNSRLAAYRKLYKDDKSEDWERIQCFVVSSLTDEQQSAYLHQVHVKGKNKWSAYEKANFAYVCVEKKGWDKQEVANIFGESVREINTVCRIIKLMKKNNDNNKAHFSYYEALTRSRDISKGMKENEALSACVLNKIKSLKDDDQNDYFTAQEMRDKLPAILKKPKILKKFIKEEIDLDTGYQRAAISNSARRVRKALQYLNDITTEEVQNMNNNDLNAFNQDFKKLKRRVITVEKIIDQRKNK